MNPVGQVTDNIDGFLAAIRAAGEVVAPFLSADKPKLTPRQQQVLQEVQSDPTATLQEIADRIGITRERVRQLCVKLTSMGMMPERRVLQEEAIRQQKEEQIATRRYRKRIWRRMVFVSHRQRYRQMAGIDHRGLTHGHHMPGEEAICQFRNCNQSVRARGFCHKHYGVLRATGALWVRRSSRYICKENDCEQVVYARNMCQSHYEAWRRKHPDLGLLPAHNTSGYRGVTQTQYGTWAANIKDPNGKQEYLGTFQSKELAARAYDTAARKYHGECARLNFPNENVEVVKKARKKSSEYRGISWDSKHQRWQVRLTRNGKQIFNGRFTDMEEAARVYDSIAYHYLGNEAQLNFPDEPVMPFTSVLRSARATNPKASQYIGVYWDKSVKKWIARVRTKDKHLNAGRFSNEHDAARAYDAVARYHHKEHARLNFPDEIIGIETIKTDESRRGIYRSGGNLRQPGGSSRYRGVTHEKNRWRARIQVEGKDLRLGSFADEESAARAYDAAATKYFGERAVLNFSDTDGQP